MRISSTVAILQLLAASGAAQDLAFTAPDLSSTGDNGFTVGQDVRISWTTPFNETSLILFERGDDGDWAFDTLAVNNAQSDTSLVWRVDTIQQSNLGNLMYFAIENGNDITCDGCVLKSPFFELSEGSESGSSPASSRAPSLTRSRPALTPSSTREGGTASASSTGGAAPTSASQSTRTNQTPGTARTSQTRDGASQHATPAMQSPGPAAAGAVNQQTSPDGADQTSARRSHDLKIGLGVGLGVGIPLLLLLLGLLFLFLRRRRRRVEQHRFSYHPTQSGNWTEDAAKKGEMQENEVADAGAGADLGAGVGAEAGAGVGTAAVTGLKSSSSQHSKASHTSIPTGAVAGVRSQSPEPAPNPFRASYASFAPSAASRKSFFEPFDFEKPQAKEEFVPGLLGRAAVAGDEKAVQPDDASSTYSVPEAYGPGSPSDAAAVAGPSGHNGAFRRPSNDMSFIAGTDLSSLEGPPQRPQPADGSSQYAAQYADGRHWPLP
ncbi:uncharacterized protein LTR77_005966 [Saxophila tyrrhenica]|uniref:Uncharacterized protein n=1 Tax=Saxophila tyrrhenica TaxID=1690608 RepID=A0AAV9P760_9PEZI|nr:hypothetical protein LTR77_005966 [Saxophila tyrrhenica]